MARTVSIMATMMAIAMLLFTTAVPHHHHHAMICLVHETCTSDGCVNDEHTGHSDDEDQEGEGHCVAHQKFFPSDEIRIDLVPAAPTAQGSGTISPVHTSVALSAGRTFFRAIPPPPVLCWRLNC